MSREIVPVVYGRLGGFHPDSGRIQRPDLARIARKPLVSCLCVTENRHAFMPWLLWSYDRQRWAERELVVIDSSEPPVELPKRHDIRVIHVPLGTSLGKKRNLALDAARGQIVAWFDDDDWQHPGRLSHLIPLLREAAARLGASFIGPSQSYFIDIEARRAEAYRLSRYAIFNGSIYYTAMVRHARFPEDVLRTEDTRWISTLLRSRQGAAIVGRQESPFLWLSHDVNVTNAQGVRRLRRDAQEVIRSLGPAWADTPEQLSRLRSRLETRPALRPARVVAIEGTRQVDLVDSEPPAAPANRVQSPVKPRPRVIEAPVPGHGVKLWLREATPTPPKAQRDQGRYGLADTLIASALRYGSEWRGADYVGWFDIQALPDPRQLAAMIGRDATAADVYAVHDSPRAPFRSVLARYPGAEALGLHLLRGLAQPDALLERNVLSLGSTWLARPGIIGSYVRDWLIPARALLENRYDAELVGLLGRARRQSTVQPKDLALAQFVLEALPTIAFCAAGLRVRALRGRSGAPGTAGVAIQSEGIPR
jgi:hypothetical protein